MTLPPPLREYLSDSSFMPVWLRIRDRLERNGHAIAGSIRLDLDPNGAERLSGLLGRQIQPGLRNISLADVEDALLLSSAKRGLIAVVAELTGAPLRDRPSERRLQTEIATSLWAHVEEIVARSGLSAYPWTREWISWLHTSGILVRTGLERGVSQFDVAARAIAKVITQPVTHTRVLGELASEIAGDAHALDGDRLAGRLAVRALGFATDTKEPVSPRERMLMWESVGVAVDMISGTVITWALRPPGDDQWSAMMRIRADLGLVTHLTIRELSAIAAPLASPGTMVSACENPQVLQRIAEASIDRPLVCFSGNPSVAGHLLADRVALRYHGDFDWPGIAIASRIIDAGALPWRFTEQDYIDAVRRCCSGLPLVGNATKTTWDPSLASAMTRMGIAVHEESLVSLLIEDLAED